VVVERKEIRGTIVPTSVPGMDVVPSTIDLSGAEIELVDLTEREYRLRDALPPILSLYDFIFIDCPPALGLLTLNALAAAQAVLVPLQTEFFALEGLSHLMRTIERVRRTVNPDLDLQGVVLTLHDRRNNLANLVAEDVRSYLGDKVYDTIIPRNVRVSEAPSHGKPILLYDIRCAGSQAYIQLARDMIRRERRVTDLTSWRSAHSWRPVWASSNWTAMRITSPARRMLPRRRLEVVGVWWLRPRPWEVAATAWGYTTSMVPKRERAEATSSTNPSASTSCEGSPDRFSSGATAMLAAMAGMQSQTATARFYPVRARRAVGTRLARLVGRTEQPVDEIGFATGHEDPSFFRRLFKRRTGVAPARYRRVFQPIHRGMPTGGSRRRAAIVT
jgi:chromosome partitioning protein